MKTWSLNLPLLLLGLTVACKPDDTDDTRTDDTADTQVPDDTGDTGDPTVDPNDFWANLDWTGSSEMDAALDLSLAPSDAWHNEVRMCVSSEWWGKGCEEYTRIAHGLSSLDLLVTPDGLFMTAMIDAPTFMNLGIWVDIDRAYAFTTSDLVNWGTHTFDIDNKETNKLIDVAPGLDGDGQPRFIYYSMPNDWSEDPANCPGDHRIKQASWDGTGFVEQDEPIFEEETFVDPTIAEIGGQQHLFATCWNEVCHATSADGQSYTFDDAFSWGGVQVPHTTLDGDELVVVAQGGGGWPPPRYRVMQADGTVGAENMLYSDADNLTFFGGSCTSPVIAYYDGLYVLLCTVTVFGDD